MKSTINLLKKVTTLSVLGLALLNLNVKETQAQRPQQNSSNSHYGKNRAYFFCLQTRIIVLGSNFCGYDRCDLK